MNMQPIFNIPYSPELNPIETFFRILKRQFRKMRLEILLQRTKVAFKSIVR